MTPTLSPPRRPGRFARGTPQSVQSVHSGQIGLPSPGVTPAGVGLASPGVGTPGLRTQAPPILSPTDTSMLFPQGGAAASPISPPPPPPPAVSSAYPAPPSRRSISHEPERLRSEERRKRMSDVHAAGVEMARQKAAAQSVVLEQATKELREVEAEKAKKVQELAQLTNDVNDHKIALKKLALENGGVHQRVAELARADEQIKNLKYKLQEEYETRLAAERQVHQAATTLDNLVKSNEELQVALQARAQHEANDTNKDKEIEMLSSCLTQVAAQRDAARQFSGSLVRHTRPSSPPPSFDPDLVESLQARVVELEQCLANASKPAVAPPTPSRTASPASREPSVVTETPHNDEPRDDDVVPTPSLTEAALTHALAEEKKTCQAFSDALNLEREKVRALERRGTPQGDVVVNVTTPADQPPSDAQQMYAKEREARLALESRLLEVQTQSAEELRDLRESSLRDLEALAAATQGGGGSGGGDDSTFRLALASETAKRRQLEDEVYALRKQTILAGNRTDEDTTSSWEKRCAHLEASLQEECVRRRRAEEDAVAASALHSAVVQPEGGGGSTTSTAVTVLQNALAEERALRRAAEDALQARPSSPIRTTLHATDTTLHGTPTHGTTLHGSGTTLYGAGTTLHTPTALHGTGTTLHGTGTTLHGTYTAGPIPAAPIATSTATATSVPHAVDTVHHHSGGTTTHLISNPHDRRFEQTSPSTVSASEETLRAELRAVQDSAREAKRVHLTELEAVVLRSNEHSNTTEDLRPTLLEAQRERDRALEDVALMKARLETPLSEAEMLLRAALEEERRLRTLAERTAANTTAATATDTTTSTSTSVLCHRQKELLEEMIHDNAALRERLAQHNTEDLTALNDAQEKLRAAEQEVTRLQGERGDTEERQRLTAEVLATLKAEEAKCRALETELAEVRAQQQSQQHTSGQHSASAADTVLATELANTLQGLREEQARRAAIEEELRLLQQQQSSPGRRSPSPHTALPQVSVPRSSPEPRKEAVEDALEELMQQREVLAEMRAALLEEQKRRAVAEEELAQHKAFFVSPRREQSIRSMVQENAALKDENRRTRRLVQETRRRNDDSPSPSPSPSPARYDRKVEEPMTSKDLRALEASKQRLVEALNAKERELQNEKARCKNMQERLKEVRVDKNAAKGEHDRLAAEVVRLENEVAALKVQLGRAKDSVSRGQGASRREAETAARLEEVEEAHRAVSAELREARKQTRAAKEEARNALRERNAAFEDVNLVEERLQDAESTLAEEATKMDELNTQMEDAKAAKIRADADMYNLKHALNEATDAVQKTNAHLRTSQAELSPVVRGAGGPGQSQPRSPSVGRSPGHIESSLVSPPRDTGGGLLEVTFQDAVTSEVHTFSRSEWLPGAIQYTSNGGARPPTRRIAYDVGTGRLRFIDTGRSVDIPPEGRGHLVQQMKQLADLAGVPHNFAGGGGGGVRSPSAPPEYHSP